MALIYCPECGEKISHTVTQCIHCGVKLQVCPECYQAYMEKVDRCSECGYKFTQKENQQQEQQNNYNANQNFAKDSEQKKENVTSPKTLIKKIKLDSKIVSFFSAKNPLGWLNFVAIACIVIVAFKIQQWVDSLVYYGDALEQAEHVMNICYSFESDVSRIKMLIFAVFALYGAVAVCNVMKVYIYPRELALWTNHKKINILDYLIYGFKMDFGKLIHDEAVEEAKSMEALLKAEILKKDNKYRNLLRLDAFVSSGIAVAALAILYDFASNIAELFMQAQLRDYLSQNNSEFDLLKIIWESDQLWFLIVFAVAFFVLPVVTKKAIYKKEELWVRTNIPEFYGKYDRYVKCPEAYSMELTVDNLDRRV